MFTLPGLLGAHWGGGKEFFSTNDVNTNVCMPVLVLLFIAAENVKCASFMSVMVSQHPAGGQRGLWAGLS